MSSEELTAPLPCPSNWTLAHLKSISTKIGSGATPTGGKAAYQDHRSNYALVRSQNVFDREFSESGLAFISDEQADGLKNVCLERDDILLNITGDGVTFGRACLVPRHVLPACVNQHVAIVRLNRKLAHPGYVLSYLTHPLIKSYIESFNAGGSRRAITKGHIESFVVPLPPMPVQKSIAETLSALDDRITLLRETNTTLEAIAQALFKSWFVDFDPVRAKAEGRQPEGLDPATAALFPDSFEESELGLVPKGWAIRSLDSVADYLNGLALQKFPPRDDAWLPVIKIAQLRKGDTVGADRAGRDIKPEYVIKNGDVLFSWSGSLEVVIWCGGEGALNQHLFKVTSNAFPKWFYYLWTRHHLPVFQQIAASKATTMGHIQRKHLTEAKVVVPPVEVIEMLGIKVEPLLDRWLANAEKSQTLFQLRDTLLPRLISGQLRIAEVQEKIEETVT